MPDIPTVYEPRHVEERLYRSWEERGLFRADPASGKPPFVIVMPPPNITGALHIGHGLDNTLQDVLIRFRRMQGHEVLWLPGTDHAGIATQNVVERELAKEGRSRHDLGREAFVARVWEWKATYGDQIINQLKRLGCSCDWTRTRFTMDEGLSQAVRAVFVRLFDEGLIYRGKRIINWCPRCETAIADVELDHVEHEGELVQFRYPLEGGGEIAVATTRLETMLGDSAIAVNPKDPRYQEMAGRMARHPFHDRLMPIVADEAVDPSFGTGAVKVTPAHDATDFEIAERHGLERINIFTGPAKLNEHGGPFAGLDRFEAREGVRQALRDLALLDQVTPHRYSIGRCSRCSTIVEPWLSEQWFVRMEPLAAAGLKAAEEGRTRFYPERWTKYYVNWLEGIRDWCISRQLWWGHRIPVFYCDACGEVWAALEDPQTCRSCGAGPPRQDPDVLDTWFSSGLWPFSTLGWPSETADLAAFYPTSVLVTGYEIIHLWVARMIMTGLHFMGEVPFSAVYVHGIVRDEQGRKMSKSLGNVIDPIVMIERYGCDALRFALAERATGQDIFLHEEWIAGARNFANKIWNAGRFALLGLESSGAPAELPPPGRRQLADRWILSKLARAAAEITRCLGAMEVAPAASQAHSFFWGELADWYIEAAKLRLAAADAEERSDAAGVLRFVLDQALRLLHPFMPFITEEIWGALPGSGESIMRAEWPDGLEGLADPDAEEEFDRLREVVGAIRSFRSDHHLDPRARVSLVVAGGDAAAVATLARERDTLRLLARLGEVHLDGAGLDGGPAARIVVPGIDLLVPLGGLLDLAAERDRLSKALSGAEEESDRLRKRLGNPGFRAKAAPEIIAENERRLDETLGQITRLSAQLEALADPR